MLTLERVKRDAAAMPRLMRVGVAALVLSLAADVIVHVAAGGAIEPIGHVRGFTPAEAAAHLAAFVTMVLILVGVVIDGVRRAREPRASTSRDHKGVA